MQIQEIIKAAIDSDPTATPQERRRILAALKEPDTNRKPRLITRKQACEILGGCSTKTISRYVKRGLIREIRFTARRIRFDESEILRLAREGVGHE